MSTPQASDGAIEQSLDKTMRDLEWSRLVRAVGARCEGPVGARLEALDLAPDVHAARAAMGETAEALALRRAGEPLPLSGIRDVRRSLERVARSGVLDGPALRDLGLTLGAARTLRIFLARRKTQVPLLFAACAFDPTLDALEDALGAAIEPDGTVRDDASPELRRLRTEVQQLRGRIVARLERMLLEHRDVVQDRFLTIREGRYVIPVRTDAHEKIPGIVHGTSGSGATVFVEPRALVDLQNRLTIVQAEMEAEQGRILARLSDLVRDRLPELRAAVDALDRADVRAASARLAEDLGGVVPEILDAPLVDLKQARHPLLVLDGVDVVPNDLWLEAGRALVLSGPNAGGKTVALELLGTLALMARAGLPVPAAQARIGFFDPVLTDVGDEQSIARNLSTFSAHVRNLATILERSGPRAMVLLDEVATGTDPGEGAALACALVDALCCRGAAVAVTTHYEPLKAMALADPRLRNASVGFDVARMAPTFEIRMDVPGASSALAVAERFGLDATVIAHARALLPEQTRTFDALVRRLEEQYGALAREREALDRARAELARARTHLDEELGRLRARDRKALSDEGQKLLALIRQTRDEIRAARAAMRKKASDAALVEAARTAIERAAKRTGPGGELERVFAPEPTPDERGRPAEPGALAPGARVWVPRLRAELQVVEGPHRGRVRVASGAVKLWVGLDELRIVQGRSEGPQPAPAPRGEAAPMGVRTRTNTLDLRGLCVDEALALTDAFLDRLYGTGETMGYVVHGVGSGALCDAVRAHLTRARPHVKRWRRGRRDEGGDGVTVVEIA